MTRRQIPAKKQEVKKILKNLLLYKPEKVILFGSAASGEYKKGGDLDFFIVKDTKKKFSERSLEVVSKYLSKTSYRHPVDIIVYTPQEFEQAKKENRIFLEQVLSYGDILYEKT